MFSTLLQAELRHWARQPIPYLFATVLFAIAFVVMWGMASEAAGGDNAEVLNSPYRLSFMTNYLSLLLLFLLPSVVGAALHRDYKSRMYTLLYAYPLTKHAYLAAKFGAAMLVVFLVVCTIGLGFILGAQMPGIPPEVIAPFRPAAYAQFYGLFLLPNMVLFGLLVFLVVIRTRNIYLAFIAVILLVAGQAIVSGLLRTADFQTLAALLDPTGDTAVKSVMRQYTLAERNVMLLPVSGVILANRLLWYGVTFILAIYTYRRFSFQQFVHPGSRGSRLELSPIPLGPGGPRPVVQPSRGGALLPLAAHNFRYVTHSYAFAALLLVGLLTVYFQQAQMNPEFGFATLPTTARMLRVPMLIFGLTINLVTFLYVGVLAHRGRMTRMGDLVDVSAVSDRTLLFSRLLAILGVQLLLLFLVMLAGVGVQLSQGYTRTEIGHYVLELFGLQFVHFAIWACLATFVHTLFTNLYVGIFVLILTGAAFSAVAEVGKFINWPFLADGVVQFNTTPRVFGGFAHSDWTGYNGVLPHYLAYKFYWLLAGGLLLTGSLAWWRRGYFFSGRERRSRVWNKGHGPLRPWLLSLGSGFLLLGAGLYYHDHVLAGYTVSDTEYERTLARNETLFTPYLAAAQPSLVRVETEAELFPGERRYQVAGTLWFVNKQERLLDTIVVNTSFKDRVTYTLGAPHLSLLVDSLVHTGAYQLTTPLHPGDSLALDFTARNAPNAPLWTNDRINSNGTYLQGYHMLPRLGVRGVFLTRKRSDYGLPEEIPTAPEADLPRIHYATTVSTDADQRAFSMGTLVRKWREGDRRYFRYLSDGPTTNTVSWLSGAYATTVDNAGIIPLQFHTHSLHQEGLDQFRRGMQQSLALNTRLFGPLAHDTLKLVEFPANSGSHATLNGNLIPTSEAYLLSDVDHTDPEAFNVPFFVGAHEVVHYWWGHRVDPADVPGGKAITEGLADFLAIQTVRETHGDDFAAAMIRRWRELYFRGRAGRGNEAPLNEAPLNDDMDYLNYRKSALAFHGLAGYWGEDRLYAALADFEQRFRHAPPPYATMDDMVATLRAAAPDSLQYLVDDYFTTITLFDNAVEDATISPTEDGRFAIDLRFRMDKFRADAKGQKTPVPVADYLDVGFYAGAELLERKRIKVTQQGNKLRFILSERPDRVVLDPDLLLFAPSVAANSFALLPE